ncbi:low choriolytic enzyme-like [Brachyhypopomus gauderio]|uniref:low choriolytic enzyme-like n=1 Tax=Brachyhypopomus gauderio TaxID=698409 RepID=UPI004041BE96
MLGWSVLHHSIMLLSVTLVLLMSGCTPVQSHSLKIFQNQALHQQSSGETDNSIGKDYFSVSAIIERANKNAGQGLDEPTVMYGDIAVYTGLQNADPCTSRGCKWPKRNGKVYVPYTISNQYSRREKDVIEGALRSFAKTTCIKFIPRSWEQDYLQIMSDSGCYSFIGRRGGGQVVSLQRFGCVYHGVTQHEVLHALGFNHEQTRSDRDRHVQILYQNIIPGQAHNFRKIPTNNLGTPYDYNSIMHYGRYAFSKNRQPTIVPIPDSSVAIGRATEMSRVDIQRVNNLYCR